MSSGLDDLSLFDLFRMEAEEQVRVLQTGLLELEAGASSAATLEALMRAAHSIKGAARIVGLDPIVQLTHLVEDRFIAAQKGHKLSSSEITRMLTATDWLARLGAVAEPELLAWLDVNTPAILDFTASLQPTDDALQTPTPSPAPATPAAEPEPEHDADVFAQHAPQEPSRQSRDIRISARRFDRIMSLASESLVVSRTLAGHAEELDLRLNTLLRALQRMEDADTSTPALREIATHALALTSRIADLDQAARNHQQSAEELYRSVLAGRLRPLSDGIRSAPRLVRDTAQALGKQVRLEVRGETTRVDRDILERLEAPISHLITNAIDHGIETPDERVSQGKPPEAHIILYARHDNGRLVISLQDDGRGIDPEELRSRIVATGLVTPQTATGLSTAELMEFLFLPGFSTRDQVDQISGRGVGLNVVQSMVQQAGGSVMVHSSPQAGTTFRLTLPVTRSVVRVLRIRLDGELFAIPLVRMDAVARTAWHPAPDGTGPTVTFDNSPVPLVALAPLLGLSSLPLPPGDVPVILCGHLAFAVDELVDETELTVRRLDARLGKIPGVSAASLDEHGLPLLILDVADLQQAALGHPTTSDADSTFNLAAPHILVVDDSYTVRELERRLLVRHGYRVTTAQNGQEAWNLLRLNDYDLLISDVDMPQMNGIELVSLVRSNPRLGRMPIIILSYKDRAEDRALGLEAGADFYLTKGDFDNENFRQAVVDLIGTADAAE